MAQILNLEELQSFIQWLDEKLSERGWSDNQLAKRAGISHPVISKARSGVQSIGFEACIKIAKALEIPPELVLKKAGLLPAAQAESAEEKELVFLFNQLPPERQKEFLKMIRVFLPEEGKE